MLIGLDNAGKSTLLNTLRNIDVDTTPTYGFISQTIRSAGGVDSTSEEAGGQAALLSTGSWLRGDPVASLLPSQLDLASP